MHPNVFKKLMVKAYLAGSNSMYCGCYDRQTLQDAKEWFDTEYGIQESEECDCCEEKDDE